MSEIQDNEILADCAWYADKYRGKNKQSGPYWSTIIRFPKLYDEAIRLQKRVDTLESYIADYQPTPCKVSKEEARKKISDILARVLTERKEDYYLDGKYFRWGKLEKNIIDIINQIGEGEKESEGE